MPVDQGLLDNELKDILSQMTAKPGEQIQLPIIDDHVTPPQPSAPVIAPSAASPKEVIAPEPAIKPSVDGPTDLDKIVDNWETDLPVTGPVVPAPSFDFQTIAKELGFEAAKTKEDLLKAVSEVKIKAEAAQQNIDVLPEDLAKAVNIAKQGGNYLEYLKVSSVDWQKQDPVLLFENWAYNALAQKGKTVEEIDDYLEKTSDLDKELRGLELQNQYTQIQQQQRLSIEAQAQAERQAFESSVQAALGKIDDVYGFKLSQSHKDGLLRDFTSKPIGRALLAQTGGDLAQALTGLFNVKYGSKIDQFRKQQIKNAVKRDLLNEIQNPKITAPGAPPAAPTDRVNPLDVYLSGLAIK
ncbi:MAG: hypothetical protein KGJ87_08810 [Planctomycetota bacterium]|nr:hypothetical protein [Planctomycetota bacterium]MDE2217241.1 hypothetical protein [Planctomycetota bacterium]